ncbi:MAG: DUF1566 domain-containing protein [Comamonadaceae bacterium]|nr:DUF1566 domain-containing protein [Comamonadaceae bacterium]
MSILYSFLRSHIPVLLACLSVTLVNANALPLNDTGIDAQSSTGARMNGGDAQYGRDAAAARGVLSKMGSSAGSIAGNANGFDFTKISSIGRELPAAAVLGSGPDDWACTYDNHTKRMWEVKQDNASHLRHMAHSYTWDLSGKTEGGNWLAQSVGAFMGLVTPDRRASTPQSITCGQSNCSASGFVQDVNAVGLCGHHDWRVPTQSELRSVVDRGRFEPAIDPGFFPNTLAVPYWSSTERAGRVKGAWATDFESGAGSAYSSGDALHIRLVRQAP